jgi:WD40 repeat protein
MAVSWDGRYLAHRGPVSVTDIEGEVLFAVRDLDTGDSESINSHGAGVRRFSIDPSGRILVSGDQKGIVRAGPLSGDEPHLLLGHSGDWIRAVAISRDGKLIATATNDEIRVWPMPDVDAPPFQILPHDEVVARLGSLTNYRVTEDRESDTGWRVEIGPFPGWATTPSW